MLQMIRSSGKFVPALTRGAGDAFDCVPDAVLLLIFNKLADVKALGRCCAVSRRFFGLASKVENAFVRVDCLISDNEARIHVKKGEGCLSNLLSFLFKFFMSPFLALQQMLTSEKSIPVKVPIKLSNCSPAEILKNFKELQHLWIELPGAEIDFEDGVLLKWKAEFGSTLESCVILGASSYAINSDELKRENKAKGTLRLVQPRTEQNLQAPRSDENIQASSSDETESQFSEDNSATIPESFYTDGGLKLRVVWTITSLIAASARHYLLQKIILDHPTLESLVLTDAVGQGTLSMSKEQLQDFRDKPLVPSASANRTQIPGLSMKLWHAPCLELPGGTCFKGATFLAIKPRDKAACKKSESFVAGAFEEPYRTATRVLAKRRTYILEMNPF